MGMLDKHYGEPVERYEYDPYGRVTIKDAGGEVLEESAIDNPYYYTGRRLDDETGLYYYRNRYYNADLGRFIQRDPLGYVDSMNLYAYTLSNPVNRDDPYGLLDPTAMDEQRRAVCGGANGCQIDMTPRTSEEAMFQGVIGVGLNSMIATSIAVPMVGAYGPAIMTGLQPLVSTAAGEVAAYGTAAITIAKTAVAEITTYGLVNYTLSHPAGASEFAAAYVGGYLEGFANEKTGTPPNSIPGVAGSLSGRIVGNFSRIILNFITADEACHSKKGCK